MTILRKDIVIWDEPKWGKEAYYVIIYLKSLSGKKI